MINLTIKTLDSQNHKFRVPDTFTILELKEHIADQVNIAVVQQRLIFCGRVLSNDVKLADIGIDGKVMHLVQKVPRLSTTTSGSSSSTTTNTNSRSGQNGVPGFRGWHTHDPTVLFGAIGIPSEIMHTGELPRLINTRNHGIGNRVSLASDMIRKANEILHRLENPPSNNGRPTVIQSEHYAEEPQQADDTSGNIPSESSTSQTQSDSDSVNVSYEVDETFPNTVVVTIDATHHMRMPPGIMRHVHNHLHGNGLHTQNSTESSADNESTTVPETNPIESTNQSSTEQRTGTSATSEPNLRSYVSTPESRSSQAINDRRRLRDLIEQLNKINTRLQPFYVQYCRFINDDPHFESTEGEQGSQRAQVIFNGVSEVMHYISHVYHAISDLRVAFHRAPPRSYQARPCLVQGTILHTAHSVSTSAATPPPPPPPPPPSTQQPTSTQTTTTSQSIPSVRAFRLDFMNPVGVANDTLNVSTSASATATETNTNVTTDANTERNNVSTEFPSETPHGVEFMFDLTPGTIRIDSVEASFVSPNSSGSNQPITVSQPSSGNETTINMPMPIDWMDQMIDVISSGVRRPFMTDHSLLDWGSIPTTSTRTPRVTPRTTDSSSTTNSAPPQGSRTRWDNSPISRMDPFLPCSSHHFESGMRPMVLARRSNVVSDSRSTSSSNNGSSSTDTTTPTSPNETRPFSSRRQGRPRTRYVQDAEGILSGIHPILTWGRNRNNPTSTSASNNAQVTGQTSSLTDTFAEHIRVGVANILDTPERDIELHIGRDFNFLQPPTSSALADLQTPINTASQSTTHQPDHQLLLTPIGTIPYFRNIRGRSLLLDLFLMVAQDWTFNDILNLNITSESSISRNPLSRHSDAIVNFVLGRIMRNQPVNDQNLEAATNLFYGEIVTYVNIFQCSMSEQTNIDFNATFRRCISHYLREMVMICEERRAGSSIDVVSPLVSYAEGILSLIVYCCNSRAVFRLTVGSLLQFLPLPMNLHRIIIDEISMNLDLYWDNLAGFQMMSLSVVNFIVPFGADDEFRSRQTSITGELQSSNSMSSSPETVTEPIPEVLGSQEWHHNVPSEWVPMIARDSQRQRRQGTQPPYSDAYLSGMPNKRRKIVTSSKPQGSLSQIIAKNLEVAMNAAGVAINKEVTASVGADIAIQSAYTEHIRTFGKSGLNTHPDFCPDLYPNATKFFFDHNNPN